MFYTRVLQGAFVAALAAAGYVILSPVIFKYLLPQYLDAVGYSNLLMLSMIFNVPGKFVTTAMQAQRMVRAMLMVTVLGSILQVALYIVWGPTEGIEGLIYAYLLGSALTLLLQIVLWHLHVARERSR